MQVSDLQVCVKSRGMGRAELSVSVYVFENPDRYILSIFPLIIYAADQYIYFYPQIVHYFTV